MPASIAGVTRQSSSKEFAGRLASFAVSAEVGTRAADSAANLYKKRKRCQHWQLS
jgi:hypothetical protein